MREKTLLRKLKRKDQCALEQLMDIYMGYVTTIVVNIIGDTMNQEDVEEVVSDVFFVLWKQADKIQDGKIKGYLSQIARRKAINKLRERKSEISIEENEIEFEAPERNPEDILVQEEQRKVVKTALLSMEHPEREIFLRHYYYYQTVGQIALEMQMNVSTVKSRLSRGRTKLKKILEKGEK